MIPELRPDIQVEYVEQPSKTWRIDLDNKRLGGFIDGVEAVAQAAYLSVRTARYRHIILSWQYGSELETLVGRDADYVFSEGKRMIAEALSTDSRITDVRDFSFANKIISFTIDTIYGSRQMEVEVQAGEEL